MASSQSILDDVKLRYRHTFTTDQVLVWLNEEQRELFDILELDSPPYAFVTVEGENFYPFPDQFDVTKIKTVTYQVDTNPVPDYTELPFARNGRGVNAPYGMWCTVVSDAFYLYIEGGVPDARTIYIYTDSDPQEVTTANLGVSPDLPTKYQEILKLGVLKRIAMARKDVNFYQNYSDTYEQKIADVLWERKLKEPQWVQPTDTQPRIESNVPWPGYGWPYWPTSAGP